MAKYNTSINNLLRNQPITAPVSGTAYTALGTDRFIDITATAAFALTLPAPSASNAGQLYTIKDVAGNAASFNITITPASGNIDGSASFVMNTNYESVSVYSDGAAYWISTQEGNAILMPWTNVSGTSATMVGNNGYYTTNASLVTLTIPASPVAGQVMEVVGVGTGLWKIAQPALQQIFYGNTSTTIGTGGSIASSAIGDSIALLCTTGGASAVWYARAGSIGNLLVT